MKYSRKDKGQNKFPGKLEQPDMHRLKDDHFRLIPAPTPDNKRVNSLFAWVSRTEAGGEGLISANLTRTGMTQLLASRESLAMTLKPYADKAMELSHRTPGTTPIISIELVEFVRVSRPLQDSAPIADFGIITQHVGSDRD